MHYKSHENTSKLFFSKSVGSHSLLSLSLFCCAFFPQWLWVWLRLLQRRLLRQVSKRKSLVLALPAVFTSWKRTCIQVFEHIDCWLKLFPAISRRLIMLTLQRPRGRTLSRETSLYWVVTMEPKSCYGTQNNVNMDTNKQMNKTVLIERDCYDDLRSGFIPAAAHYKMDRVEQVTWRHYQLDVIFLWGYKSIIDHVTTLWFRFDEVKVQTKLGEVSGKIRNWVENISVPVISTIITSLFSIHVSHHNNSWNWKQHKDNTSNDEGRSLTLLKRRIHVRQCTLKALNVWPLQYI